MNNDHAPIGPDEPDRLPGESRGAYRRRTIPGYAEEEKAKRRQQKAKRRQDRLDGTKPDRSRPKPKRPTFPRHIPVPAVDRDPSMGTVENPLPPMAPYGLSERMGTPRPS